MDGDARALIAETLAAAIALHEHMLQHAQPVIDAAAAVTGALRGGGKLMVFGNGGSAADAQLGISTSGASPNVVAALETARALGLQTIALTGRDGGAVGRAAAIHVNVPSDNTARVQEVHRTLLHVMCDLVERSAVDA